MITPNDEYVQVCSAANCGKVMPDDQGTVCTDCIRAICPEHTYTAPCRFIQCLECAENDPCHCGTCDRARLESAAEARFDAMRETDRGL